MWTAIIVPLSVRKSLSHSCRRRPRIISNPVNSLNDVVFFHVVAIHGRPRGLFHAAWIRELIAAPPSARLIHSLVVRSGVSDVGIHQVTIGTATAIGRVPACTPVDSDIFNSFALTLSIK